MNILNWNKFNEKVVGKVAISDFQSYIEGMSAAYVDKLFFLNIIDPDVIVDFGCANGLILSKIKEIRPNIKLIGYDLDEKMLSQARNLLGNKALLTSSWQDVKSELKKFNRPALVLSSVIHEVYSYSNSMTIKKFWDNQVLGGDFKWIAIRDMLPSVEIHKQDISKFRDDVEKVRQLADPKYLDSFENIWGTIDDNYRTFTHYLLKYRFTDNWEREVKENYLPVSLETIYKKLPSNYKIVYESNFILPYLQQKVKEDFDIELRQTTHTKMVIVNTSFKANGVNEEFIPFTGKDDDVAKDIIRDLSVSDPDINKEKLDLRHFNIANRFTFELNEKSIELINARYTRGQVTVEKFYLKVNDILLECSNSILRKMRGILNLKIKK